jgi:hypothetical protein
VINVTKGLITVHQESTGFCVYAHIGDPGPSGAMEALNAIPWLHSPSHVGNGYHFKTNTDDGEVTWNGRTYNLNISQSALDMATAIHEIVQAAIVAGTA